MEANILNSFATVTRFVAVIESRPIRLAVSSIIHDAPHNGEYGFLAASDKVQALTKEESVTTSEKMHLYTVRDALKEIHEALLQA